MLTDSPQYKTEETELPDKDIEDILKITTDFQHTQAYLAFIYHKIDKTLHQEGIE